jgi:hypothetical protein
VLALQQIRVADVADGSFAYVVDIKLDVSAFASEPDIGKKAKPSGTNPGERALAEDLKC